MYVGYDDSGEQPCPYSDLDEFLCEYVDGEMDPSVRAAFEEIVSRDPALAEHVECLRQTRAMLCAYSHRVGAPCSLHARLHYELSRELMREEAPLLTPVTSRLGRVATFASAVVLTLAIGLYVSETPLSNTAPVVAEQGAGRQTQTSERLRSIPHPLHPYWDPSNWEADPQASPRVQPPYASGFAGTLPVVHTQSAFPLGYNGTLLQTAGYTQPSFSRLP
jgi:hypothetical protein